MTASAAPVSTTTKPASRSGLWTFLRLLGGWACIAALAYVLSSPSKEWGWPTLLFAWVLLTLLADEFAGWFGYIALVLGALPLLWHTPPEQWFVILPLVGGALFALLIVKHSGGPFVLPFAGAIFAGALLVAGKLGPKLDPGLTLPANHTFQNMALRPMVLVLGFSFVRQLVSMLWRWQVARRARMAQATPLATISHPIRPAFDAAEGLPETPDPETPAPKTPVTEIPAAATPASETIIITPKSTRLDTIDLDLSGPDDAAPSVPPTQK